MRTPGIAAAVVAALALAAGMLGTAPAYAVAGGQEVADPAVTTPWMVTLASKPLLPGDPAPLRQRLVCGGTLIAPDRVLTAAHCVYEVDPTTLEVHVGAGALSQDPGHVVPLKGWSVNPDFRLLPPITGEDDFWNDTGAYDAAVLELAHPVFGVPVMHLATRRPPADTPVAMYGHGLTRNPDPADPGTAQASDALRRGDLRVLDGKTCVRQAAADNAAVDETSTLCAVGGPRNPATSACSGDSGGPLVVEHRGVLHQVGIDSFQAGTAPACGVPDGFTDVAKIRSWARDPRLPLAPMTTEPPRVDGPVQVGSRLTCRLPHWSGGAPGEVEFQWFSAQGAVDGSKAVWTIDGATRQTFTPTAEQISHPDLTCRITAHSAGGIVEMYAPIVALRK